MREYENLKDPATAPWGLTFTFDAYNKMLKGFIPTSMDIKWEIVTDTPDAHGNTVVHLYRSWTMKEIISLTIEAGKPCQTEATDWGTIVEIAWHKQPGHLPIKEESAKRDAVGILNGYLQCGLKRYDESDDE
jgi:hypothetical protein